jgi:hypothetical protein
MKCFLGLLTVSLENFINSCNKKHWQVHVLPEQHPFEQQTTTRPALVVEYSLILVQVDFGEPLSLNHSGRNV